MAIISVLPVTLTNGTTADAVAVMSDLNHIVNQVNANAADASLVALKAANNNFTLVQTGVAATAAAHFPIASQVQNQVFNTLSSTLGTNTLSARVAALALPAYAIGQVFTFIPSQTNTGSATMNVDSLGSGVIQSGGAQLIGGELKLGVAAQVEVTSTTPVFQLISGPVSSQGTFTATLTGCTTVPTATAVYSVTNNVVTLFIPTLAATSNTTACTITGLPAVITPATTHLLIPAATQDNTLAAISAVDVTNGGVITLRNGSAMTATFTASGTKGLAGAPLTITYNLN